MRICSVTLAGPGREHLIGDALRSVVDWVDLCAVIDTSVTGRVPFPEAADVCGRKLRWNALPWKDDFSLMRNSALDIAAAESDGWALWLDTDERMVCPDPDLLKQELSAQPHTICALRAWHISGEYGKERFIRLPRRGEYVGPTHEYWHPEHKHRVGWAMALRFDEVPRDFDAPEWQAKLDRDHRILEAHVQTHPEARWYYYLADSYGFTDPDKALAMWEKALTSPGHGEIRAWAAFRAANALIEREDYKRAKQLAMTGLMVYPHGADLFWVLAVACEKLGQNEEAVSWAMHAGAAGSYKGWGREVNRTGYVYPPAQWEAPFDVIARAYAKMGMKDLAKAANAECKAAKAMREAA